MSTKLNDVPAILLRSKESLCKTLLRVYVALARRVNMVKFFLLLACLTVLGTTHAAELRDFLTVTPAVPASGEPFVVVFSGIDSICEEQSPISSVVGHRLILDLRVEYVCSPNLTGFPVATDFRFEIPGLQPGTYQIEFYSNLQTQTFPPALGVAVTVPATVPAMNNAGIFLLLVIIGLLGVYPLAVFAGRQSKH